MLQILAWKQSVRLKCLFLVSQPTACCNDRQPIKTTGRSIPAANPVPESPTPEQPTRDRASHYGLALTDINRAIDAIMAYNDNQPLHELKWAISLNAIRSFVNAPNEIEKVLKERAQELADHHQKHQLDLVKHNLRHRRKRQIFDMIHLEGDNP